MLGDGSSDTTIVTFTSDNCSDSGTIPGTGTSYTYDFGSGVKKYGLRSQRFAW